MRKFLIFILMLGVALSLVAAPLPPAQVKITLTTKVPEFLAHGFLTDDDGEEVIVSSTSVYNAFDAEGARFTYAVKTNVSFPLTVSAEITPFQGEHDGTVSIKGIYVKPSQSEQEVAASPAGVGTLGDRYDLFSFSPNISGMATYAYSVRVVADQDEVADAAVGNYESTVSIGISTQY
ncbi:MAG: hypothetical protein WC233_07685 [Sphaerochaeta sp.]